MRKKESFPRDRMFYKFCFYGFLKNQRFFEPFLILFFRESGISFFHIGLLISIREISINILEIPTGIIADAYGRKKTMVFSFLSYIISFLIFYFFRSFLLYSVAMIFFAMGEAFRTGTHKAMILHYLKVKNLLDYKVDYYGHTRGFSQLGSAVSTLIAILIVFSAEQYRPVFLFSVFPYISSLFLILSYPSYLDGEIETITGMFKEKLKKRFLMVAGEFKKMFLNFEALKAILNSSLFDGFFKSSKDYLQPILKSQALSIPVFLYLSGKQRTSLIVGTVYFFLYIFTSIASSKSSSFVGKLKSLHYALNSTYIAGAILLFLCGLFTSFKLFVVSSFLFILFYILQNLRRPVNVAYISDKISPKTMASGLSVESQMKTVTVMIISPLLGFLADKFGIGPALVVISFLFLFSFPLVIIK